MFGAPQVLRLHRALQTDYGQNQLLHNLQQDVMIALEEEIAMEEAQHDEDDDIMYDDDDDSDYGEDDEDDEDDDDEVVGDDVQVANNGDVGGLQQVHVEVAHGSHHCPPFESVDNTTHGPCNCVEVGLPWCCKDDNYRHFNEQMNEGNELPFDEEYEEACNNVDNQIIMPNNLNRKRLYRSVFRAMAFVSYINRYGQSLYLAESFHMAFDDHFFLIENIISYVIPDVRIQNTPGQRLNSDTPHMVFEGLLLGVTHCSGVGMFHIDHMNLLPPFNQKAC